MNFKISMYRCSRTSLAVLSAFSLLQSCQRQPMVKPEMKETDATSQTLVTRAVAFNLFAGNPKTFVVQIGQSTTFAGTGAAGLTNAQLNHATFNAPTGIASDRFGNLYVADQVNNVIRKIDRNFNVTTYAGTGQPGSQDGPALSATFHQPAAVTVGADGTVYVADALNNRIRSITPDGMTHTVAGNSKSGFNDGQGIVATFSNPSGIAIDGNGTIYVADAGNNKIRRISPTGGVTQWAGSLQPGNLDGTGTAALFNRPTGIAVGPDGSVYVADENNHLIRKIRSGVVTTLAGSGIEGSTDSVGAKASFDFPSSLATDSLGNIYVTDLGNLVSGRGSRIRMVTPAGSVSTLVGDVNGYRDSWFTNASFLGPTGITVDPFGNIMVADRFNNRIRSVVFSKAAQTFAGNGQRVFQLGRGQQASFPFLSGLVTDKAGNVYVSNGFRVSKITPDGTVTSYAGSDTQGFANDTGDAAEFGSPGNLGIDSTGNIFVTDFINNAIRVITPTRLTIAIPGIHGPFNMAVDKGGNIFVATIGGPQTTIMRIPAHSFTPQFFAIFNSNPGDDHTIASMVSDDNGGLYVLANGTGSPTLFHYLPNGTSTTVGITALIGNESTTHSITKDGNNLYISVSNGILRWDVRTGPTNTTLIAGAFGDGAASFADAPLPFSLFNGPGQMGATASGILYVVDTFNDRVRMIPK